MPSLLTLIVAAGIFLVLFVALLLLAIVRKNMKLIYMSLVAFFLCLLLSAGAVYQFFYSEYRDATEKNHSGKW